MTAPIRTGWRCCPRRVWVAVPGGVVTVGRAHAGPAEPHDVARPARYQQGLSSVPLPTRPQCRLTRRVDVAAERTIAQPWWQRRSRAKPRSTDVILTRARLPDHGRRLRRLVLGREAPPAPSPWPHGRRTRPGPHHGRGPLGPRNHRRPAATGRRPGLAAGTGPRTGAAVRVGGLLRPGRARRRPQHRRRGHRRRSDTGGPGRDRVGDRLRLRDRAQLVVIAYRTGMCSHGRAAGERGSPRFPRQLQGAAASQVVSWAHSDAESQALLPPLLAM